MKHIHTPGEYRSEMEARCLHLAIEENERFRRCVVLNAKQEIVACSSWYPTDEQHVSYCSRQALEWLACEDALKATTS